MSRNLSGNSEPINAVTADRQSIHPIHRCPVDVLQCIFENAVPPMASFYNSYSRQTPWWHATRLCSVCRHWRDVVLATPSLWTSIFIDFNKSVEKVGSCWIQATRRVKSAPAMVYFNRIGERDYSEHFFPEITDPKLRERIEERFRLCSLQTIPWIHTLQLNVAVYRYPLDVLSLMKEFPRCEMERLEIEGAKLEKGDDPQPEETWNTLLHRFPPFKSLKMSKVGPVIFSLSAPFVALVDLYIVDASEVNITTIMAVCPNLQRLSVYSWISYSAMDVSGMDLPRSTPHSLRFLEVGMVENFPWDRLGQLPSLSEFKFRADSWEIATPQAVIDFIQAHSSITSVSLFVPDPRLVQLALVAPQLTSLVIVSVKFNLEGFLDWKAAEMDAPAFPMLQTMGFHTPVIQYPSLNLQTFEAFVRKRCLPNSHPECALEMGLKPVRQLNIRGGGEWLSSKYMVGATLCQIRDIDCIKDSDVTLSWV